MAYARRSAVPPAASGGTFRRSRHGLERAPAGTVVDDFALPNGLGLDSPSDNGSVVTGLAPNELTSAADRDPLAGTPWHKHVPARIEAVPTRIEAVSTA